MRRTRSGVRTAVPRAIATATGLLGLVGLVPTAAAQTPEPLLVHGAASLSSVLPELLRADGGQPVRFSFDATSRLATTLREGAPGDVFVAADPSWMAWLDQQGALLPGSQRTVASNRLVLAGGTANAVSLRSLQDVTTIPPRSLAVAGEAVPAGRYAEEALRNAGIWEEVGSQLLRAGSVRSAAEWVARGEVAVGLLYRSDVAGDPRLEALALVPAELHSPIAYTAAVLASTDRPEVALGVVERLAGAESAGAWDRFGFGDGDTMSLRAPLVEAQAPALSLRGAVLRSLAAGLLATLLGLVPALWLGWVLARREFPGKALVSTLTLVPLVVPPVVTGFLLLWLFGARSPIGRGLTALGIQVPFTLVGAVVAAAVVGFPLYVLTIRAAFESIDRRYEDLAATLGDPPLRRFMRISLPLALPGIFAAAVLAFARGLGEFGATIVLAGNLEGSTRTIPLAVYTLLESPTGRSQIWILVAASVGLCLLALVGYEWFSARLRSTMRGWRG